MISYRNINQQNIYVFYCWNELNEVEETKSGVVSANIVTTMQRVDCCAGDVGGERRSLLSYEASPEQVLLHRT